MKQLTLPGCVEYPVYKQLEFEFVYDPPKPDPLSSRPAVVQELAKVPSLTYATSPTEALEKLGKWFTYDPSVLPAEGGVLLDQTMSQWKERLNVVMVAAAWQQVEKLSKWLHIVDLYDAELEKPERLEFMRTGELIKVLKYVTGRVNETLAYIERLVNRTDVTGLKDALKKLTDAPPGGTMERSEASAGVGKRLTPVERHTVRMITERLIEKYGD